MQVLFVVTSAIHTKFGVYSKDERIQQTLDTFKSIEHQMGKTPEVQYDICLIEMGQEKLTPVEERLFEPYVDYLFDYTGDEQILEISRSPNWDIVKSSTEMLCFWNTITTASNTGVTDGSMSIYRYDRVFKVSGRYTLTDDFNVYEHLNTDMVVFAQKRDSQFKPETTLGRTKQYMTRLWSWPVAKTADVLRAYSTAIDDHANTIQRGGYVDIEHLLYQHIPQSIVKELPVIGICGNISPNGVQVND